jgi:hypothetical protein
MSSPLELRAPLSRVDTVAALRDTGFAVLGPEAVATAAHVPLEALDGLERSWDDLPPDAHLRDGGAYRFRRHSCFVHDVERGEVLLTPHRAHYQPVTYNALHGGMERWFSPLHTRLAQAPGFVSLVRGLGLLFAEVRAEKEWFVEAHAFRIDPREGVGRPTPEGAHRDGVDFVAVVLVDRQGVRGGETRVFDAEGPNGVRFSLSTRWSALLLDDPRVVHETTPILLDAPGGHRDTLVLTYRAGGFQARLPLNPPALE